MKVNPALPIIQPEISGESLSVRKSHNNVPQGTAAVDFETINADKSNRARKWATRGLIGLAVGSASLTVASDSVGEAKEAIVEAAPWVGVGIATSEIMFVAGGAIMVGSVGEKLGNPFTLKRRLPEIVVKAGDSKVFRAGLAINTIGAFGDAGVIAAGTFKEMPVEAWGVAGLAAIDGVGTLVARRWMIDKYRETKIKTNNEEGNDKELKDSLKKPKVRTAVAGDMDRLTDIDISRFRKAYGENLPTHEEIKTNFLQRYANSPDYMFVVEIDGEIEGFVSAFRTNKPSEEFVSWEDSTSRGTLKDVVDPDGKYVYVTNMTVNPAAMKLGGEDMLLANLFANGIEDGIEYGYFASRMPLFQIWLKRELKGESLTPDSLDESELSRYANIYRDTEKQTKNGMVRFDPELRMYEEAGFTLGKVVSRGFNDEASMDFAVVCEAAVPPKNKILKSNKLIRKFLAGTLRQVAKSPRLIEKYF